MEVEDYEKNKREAGSIEAMDLTQKKLIEIKCISQKQITVEYAAGRAQACKKHTETDR